MEFRPSLKSFFGSLLWSFSPIIVAGIVTYFMYESVTWKWFLLASGGLMALLSLFLVTQSIYVHLNKIYLDDYCIRTSGPLCTIELRWQSIASASLRERVNAASRTDHLLILQDHNGRILSFNTSTLSPTEEGIVLRRVGEKTNLRVQRDSPSL